MEYRALSRQVGSRFGKMAFSRLSGITEVTVKCGLEGWEILKENFMVQ